MFGLDYILPLFFAWDMCEYFWGVPISFCQMGTGFFIILISVVALALFKVRGSVVFYTAMIFLAMFTLLGWYPIWGIFIIGAVVALMMITKRGAGEEPAE